MAKKAVRPDFSDYVVHFCKDAAPFSNKSKTDPKLNAISKKSAQQRLFSILKDKQLRATRMPWTNREAVCFTECTWASLLDHSRQYSRFGLGFSKSFLFSRGGGPAIYLTPGLLEHQKKHVADTTDKDGNPITPLDPTLFAFVTPFCPPYAPTKYKNEFWKKPKAIDYSHEREWRVPHNLDFSLSDVAFVVVASYDDMAKAPKDLKDGVGRENWLLMDNYEKIETLWPVHQMP